MKTKSIVTTSFGVVIGLCGVGQFLLYLLDGNPNTTPDLSELVTILTGCGLMAAKDWNASHAGTSNPSNEKENRNEHLLQSGGCFFSGKNPSVYLPRTDGSDQGD